MTEINYKLIIEFLAHVVVCDCQIDNRELIVINEFLSQNNFDNDLKGEIDIVLNGSPNIETQNQVIHKLKNTNEKTIEQALIAGLSVAYSDGYFDPTEQDIFSRFLNITGYEQEKYLNYKQEAINSLKNKDFDKNENSLLNFTAPILKPLLKKLSGVATGNIKTKIDKLQTKLLLSGDEYNDAIKKCANLATEDFKFIEQILDTNISKYENLITTLDKTLSDIKKIKKSETKQVVKSLTELKNNIKEILLQRLEKNQETLYKKKRAVNNYTISFLGKTKAGKSTLHSIITGEGKEHIGVGKQRTTRCNRVYVWENIKIIDTPGIGAPGGKTDEQIAESIIDETDIICYILKNESIQETEFKFLKLIKEKNKPIIIILNAKENIRNSILLKLFLNNPEEWYTRKDKQSLQGHINRIRNYAEKHYQNNYFEIFPIQLLAAQLSKEDEYKQYSKKLYSASHLQDFLDAIRVAIIENGILKRSHTVLDGSSHTLNQSIKMLKEFSAPLTKMAKELKNKLPSLLKKLNKNYKIYKKYLTDEINTNFNQLKENAYIFASQNYKLNEKELSKAWKKNVKNIKFDKNLHNSIQSVTDEYAKSIENDFKEVIEDLKLFNEFKIGNINFSTYGTFSFQSIFDIGALLTGVGATILTFIPHLMVVGLILGGVAIGLKLLGGLFESKEKKRTKAIETLYSSLEKSIEENKQKVNKNVLINFDNSFNNLYNNTEKSLTFLIQGIENNINKIQPISKYLEKQDIKINKVFAWRILNFAQNKEKTEIDFAEIDSLILNVERERGNFFNIQCDSNINNIDTSKLSKIIQEDINFKN